MTGPDPTPTPEDTNLDRYHADSLRAGMNAIGGEQLSAHEIGTLHRASPFAPISAGAVQATPVFFNRNEPLPFDDLPADEQQLIHEICLERVTQLSQNRREVEDRQGDGELLQAATAYVLEAQAAVTGSVPIIQFQDLHPDPDNAEVFGPRENIIVAIGLLLAQLRVGDERALRAARGEGS